MRRRSWWILFGVAYALLRWVLLLHPGYVADMNAYKRWALRASQEGIAQIYATSDMDYPPLYAWILAPVGTVYGWIDPHAKDVWTDPEAARVATRSRIFNLLVKLPPLVFDLGVGWLLFRVGRRAEAESRRRGAGPSRSESPGRISLPWSAVLPVAYLANPAVLFDTAYWGQADSIHSFFILASFLALGFPEMLPAGQWFRPRQAPGQKLRAARSAWPAWVLLALATLMKPLGAPFFPLLFLLTLAWCGWRGVVTGAIAAGITGLLIFTPFIASGQVGSAFQRVVHDVGLMPYTSSNAHNLWWAIGGWKPADNPVLGPLTLTHLGLAGFGLAYAALLAAAWKACAGDRERLTGSMGLLLALGIAFSFFMLSTHLHENHLFFAIPLSLALAASDPPGRRTFALLAAALSLGLFANLILHDLVIPERFPFTLGGQVAQVNLHLKRPFYLGELTAIRLSVPFNLALFAAFFIGTLRRGGLLARLSVTTKD